MAAQAANNYSVGIHYVHAALKHCRHRHDKDIDNLLEQSAIPKELLDLGWARVSVDQYARLQQNVTLALGDEIFGYTDRPLPLGSWKIMCHACISAETLGEALQHYCDFYNLIDCGISLALRIEGGRVIFSPQPTRGEFFERFAHAVFLFNTHRFSSWLTERFLPVTAFRFACPKPHYHREYRSTFLHSRVLFDQSEYNFEFAAKYLASPIRQDIASLRRFIRDPIRSMLTLNYNSELWSAKVRKIIEADLQHPPNFMALAEQLGIHQQTLRRRLIEEGTNYREIKNDIRFDTAIYYLDKPNLSIQQISDRVGFSEASAFVRAFKLWTGQSPDQYRKQSIK